MSAAFSLLLTAVLISALFACPRLSHAQAASSSAGPIITGMAGCPGQSGSTTFGCQFRGNLLVLNVTGSGLDWTRQIVNVSGGLCTPSGGTATFMQCSMYNPADYPMPGNTLLPVTVFDLVSGLSSPAVPLISFITYPPVTLTSLSGCEDNGTASTYNCSTSTSILTITGSGFVDTASGSWQLSYTVVPQLYQYRSGLTSFPVYSLSILNSTTMTFPLSALVGRGGLPGSGRLCLTLFRAYIIQPSSFLCLTFQATPSNSQPPPSLNVSQPVITGVSGCNNDGNVTLGCTRTSYITISGTGFPLLGVVVSVGDEGCQLMQQGQTETQVLCYLPRAWNGLHSAALLPVVVMGLWNAVQSAPFYGLQMAPVLIPSLSSISGCQGAGLLTSNCQLQTGGQVDTLTIIGSQLTASSDYYQWNLWFGPYLKTNGYYFTDQQTSTAVTVPLNASRAQMDGLRQLAALDLANSSVYVLLTKDVVVSNALAISLAPVLLNISGLDGCSPAGPFLLQDCVPGDSYLRIFATNIFPPLSVTVADQPCTQLELLPGFVSCLLAAPEGFLPELPYDVVVTQGSNAYVLPSAVAFTSRPVILSVTSDVCAPDYLSPVAIAQLGCMAGDPLTIVGSFVASPDSLAVLLIGGQVSVLCDSPVLLSIWALSCVLPSLNASQAAALLGVTVQVQVVFNATSLSNLVSVGLYRSASSVGVTSLSGCQQQDEQGRGVDGCVTGAVLTVSGQNFGPSAAVELYELDSELLYLCQLPVVLNATQLTCRVPYIASLESQGGSTLPIRVRQGASTSNWLLGLGYSATLPSSSPSSPPSSASSFRSAFIACLVLSVALSIALLGLLTRLCVQGWAASTAGKQGRGWRPQVDGASGGSQSARGVELL